ncbi:TPA: ImcF-related family protein, partial [Klebsiella pneumoniae]
MHTARYGFWGYLLLIIGLAGICALLIFINQDLLARRGVSAQQAWSLWGGIFAILLFGLVCSPFWWLRKQKKEQTIYRPEVPAKNEKRLSDDFYILLKSKLRSRYGLLWRHKVRLLLVMGESTQVEAIAPGLTAQRWQEGEHTVLIYGGSASAAPDTTLLTSLKRLRHFRPLDGI